VENLANSYHLSLSFSKLIQVCDLTTTPSCWHRWL